MHLPELELYEPTDLAEAGALLTRLGPRARVMAGGTDLLTDLKTGRVAPCDVVSLARVGGLRGVEAVAAGLRIGALTTIAELLESPLLTGPFAILAEAAGQMAAPQVRNSATIGGNIAGAVPCADLPPALVTLDASVILWSPAGSRTVPLDSFFLGPRKPALRAGEILTQIVIPAPPTRFGAAYCRFSLRSGNTIAVAGVAASLSFGPAPNDPPIAAARVMLAAVAPIPKRATAAEGALVGRRLEDWIDEAAAQAAGAAEPISDVRGSAAYRRELVRVLARRALHAAGIRALEGRP